MRREREKAVSPGLLLGGGHGSRVLVQLQNLILAFSSWQEFKMEVYQQQIEMEKLNHQGELMLKKATDETDRHIIREPLTELKHLWENLSDKIAHRQVWQTTRASEGGERQEGPQR